MSPRTSNFSIEGPPPPAGRCPCCGQEPGGERCLHCGIAVRVGPYRVRQLLGQRGAARTYLADDSDGLAVLKELSFFTEPDAATLEAFHQEARQLQALTHPRIPRYLDMLQLGVGLETRLYLVQEFIEGSSLETALSSRRTTEWEARELARQVLNILQYLQGRTPPVFHGGLKPANLIRRPDEALFLVDFGAAWVPAGADSEPSRCMPPGQAAGALDASTALAVREEPLAHHQPRLCELAKSGTPSASGSFETGVPRSAFDHAAGTLWRSNASTGAWLQVDLGQNRVLTDGVVDWDTRFGSSAQSLLQTSLDGVRWSPLHTVRNTATDNNVARRLKFPQRVARYVRFTGTGWNGGWAHVRSLELYGPDCPLESNSP